MENETYLFIIFTILSAMLALSVTSSKIVCVLHQWEEKEQPDMPGNFYTECTNCGKLLGWKDEVV